MPTVFALSADTSAVTGMLTDAMKQALTSAFNGISADVFYIMGVALPVGLGIAGVFIAIKLGVRFFRSIAN